MANSKLQNELRKRLKMSEEEQAKHAQKVRQSILAHKYSGRELKDKADKER